MKKLLTIEDLMNYFSSTSQSCHFSSKDSGQSIVVQIQGHINFESETDSTDGLMPVVLQSCHIDLNDNGSNIKQSVMEDALPSFSNRPILGFIHEVDGQPEFYGHNMHINEDEEIEYDEIPVGIIPESCNARLEYDKEEDKTYCVVNGYIFEEYSKAASILKREKKCYVSVEIDIKELSYNAKEKYLEIEKFTFSGVTILGKNENGDIVQPGMSGANIQLSDFSKNANSVFSKETESKLIEAIEKLNHTLSTLSVFNIDINQKGGTEPVGKFEELLTKYNVTAEDITFNYEGMTDEELESKFAELFNADPASDNSNASAAKENFEGDPQNTEGTPATEEKMQRTFEISHEDVRYALYNLLIPYEEEDDTWYWISAVYDTYFVYSGYNDTYYGQKYTVEDDNVAFSGERYRLYQELLTESEKLQLDEMRSNYTKIKEQLAQYQSAEEDAKKVALFDSEEYKNICEQSEFSTLKENYKDYSLDELTGKLDDLLLSYAKSNAIHFSSKTKPVVPKKSLADMTDKRKNKRYGTLKFN